MKKILLALSFVALFSLKASAATNEIVELNLSSFTLSNDTLQRVPLTRPGSILVGIVVSSGMINGAGITLYDSSKTATNQIGFVSGYSVSQNPVYIPYNVVLSSALTYTTTLNSGGFSIIYKLTHPR